MGKGELDGWAWRDTIDILDGSALDSWAGGESCNTRVQHALRT
jgi:hypothetical protein